MRTKTWSRIIIPQMKAFRIMNFQSRDSFSSPLFRSKHILKLEDKILMENVTFISRSFNNLIPPIFQNLFTFCSDIHNYHTFLSTVDKTLNYPIQLILMETHQYLTMPTQ